MFSNLAIEHIQSPRNVGPLGNCTHYGVAGVPGDGPFVEFWFDVIDDQIKASAYKTNGCPTSIASASIIAELLRGKNTSVAIGIDERDITILLAYVPEGKEDCPERVVNALQDAFGEK